MKLLIIGLLVLVVLVVSCESNSEKISVSVEKQCLQDSECVANICCHAKDAVNKQHAPDCKSVMCTMSCEPGTLDCGQGEAKCVEKQCRVVINN